MRLDVVIATRNRRALLERALNSLRIAPVPPGLAVGVTVVDNASTDGTHRCVEDQAPHWDGRLRYVHEPRLGKSHALNTGIAATGGELVGMIDDDEEIDRGWYARVHRAFQDEAVDFVGGPYHPRWGAEPPKWLPTGYRAVIGWIDGGDRVRVYGGDYPGMLMGGNAVIRRRILERVGPYSPALGPSRQRLLAGEDEDMYQRLLAAGAHGLYLPDLIVHHFIPPERLSKRYYRRWCFWRGVSQGLIDRERRRPVVYLGGAPRHMYGSAARGLIRLAGARLRRGGDPSDAFTRELALWDLAGFLYGKHIHRA